MIYTYIYIHIYVYAAYHLVDAEAQPVWWRGPGPRPGNSGSRRLSCTALTSSQLSGEARTAGQMTRAARNAMCGETAKRRCASVWHVEVWCDWHPSKSNDQGLLSCCLVGQPKSILCLKWRIFRKPLPGKIIITTTPQLMWSCYMMLHTNGGELQVSFLWARYGPCGPWHRRDVMFHHICPSLDTDFTYLGKKFGMNDLLHC